MIKKRKRVLSQVLSYRQLKVGGLSPAFEAGRGRRLTFLLRLLPTKGLPLEEAFLKYLRRLVLPFDTSHPNPPLSIYY